MDTIEQIEDFGTLQLHARHLAFELEFFQKRNAEMAKEIARLKELSPEQLQREIARQGEQLAKLRHKVFGASTERRPNPAPPDKPEKKPKRGHPTTQTKLPKREVHHRLADDERECPVCQGMLEEMGELTEDAEEITVEKRRFFVDKHLRHKYRCGRCSSVVKTAPGPLILGLSIAVDATALTSNIVMIPGVTPNWVLSGAVQQIRTLPGTYGFQTPAGHAPFSFQVTADGKIAYDAKFDPILAGRGSDTLTVCGVSIIVDASSLTSRPFMVPGITPNWVDGKIPQSVTVVPGNFAFQTSAGHAPFTFQVDLDGKIAYDSKLDSYLGGRNTKTLIVRRV